MSERVFVAMSGGVDSSLAAALLQERGEEVVGIWMRLTPGTTSDGPRCCGTDEAGEQAGVVAAFGSDRVWAADICVRMRAFPCGTTGYEKPIT